MTGSESRVVKRTETNVSTLVDMIERGELQLPEMQRRYVWPATKVRDLLDSLYRWYPSGTILVWETDIPQPNRALQIAQSVSPFSIPKLLLDGQQRLTSLSAVLRDKPITVRNKQRPIEIAFNLDHPTVLDEEPLDTEDDAPATVGENGNDEEDDDNDLPEDALFERLKLRTFTVASRPILHRKNWVRVSDVFRKDVSEYSLIKPLVSSPEDPKYEMYSERLRKLKSIASYPYSMEVLDRSLSYEEVTNIFVRVNSLGTKLRGSDLALAQITAKWHGSLGLLEQYAKEVEDRTKLVLDIGLLVRAMVVFATQQSRFKTVSSLSKETLEAAWDRAKKGLDFSLNFIRSNAGFESLTQLASTYYLLPIAVFGELRDFKLVGGDAGRMLSWLYGGNIRGHYSGSSETRLDADLALLHRGSDFSALEQTLIQRYGRLTVNSEDMKGRGLKSALFTFAYLASKFAGATDWETGVPLSLGHQGQSYVIEFHHIFPKSLLQKSQIWDKSEINEISNFAFISGRANRRISNEEPGKYLPKVMARRGSEPLLAQGIAIIPEEWDLDKYGAFLSRRRTALADMINDFVELATKQGQVKHFANASPEQAIS